MTITDNWCRSPDEIEQLLAACEKGDGRLHWKDESMPLLTELANCLDRHAEGKEPLSNRLAAVYRDVIIKIIEPEPYWSNAASREFSIALYYAESKLLAGPGRSKIARAETADIFGTTDKVVSTYASRHKKEVMKTIARFRARAELAEHLRAMGEIYKRDSQSNRKHTKTFDE